ncbi:MAG TPA: hypothetical protein VFU91_03145 [Sphingomicrobium sp.]|nr:hypothetical protein [Sphingomicrobium sp.]
MITRSTKALVLSTLLAACSSKSHDSFDQDFKQNFVSSCVHSATSSGVAQDLASKTCTCAADKVQQRFSMQQKMHLTKEQLTPIMMKCRASIAR